VTAKADEDGSCVHRAKRTDLEYTQLVLTEFRARIARLLALCVFVLTFGRVQVNVTGRPTVAGPGRDDTDFSATHVPESGSTSPP
jgi:hypothetical protein